MNHEAMLLVCSRDTIPLISVVLPVYNGEKYLSEAINSILEQTIADFELIIINDGSTDGSLAIIEKYQQSDTRIRVISRENKGLVNTLNESIEIARGEMLARMDQDDIALPYRFERQLNWLTQTEADICGSWVQRFGSKDKRIVRSHQSDEAIKIEMLFASPFAHPTVMMRTSLIKELRYEKAWEKAEDYDLWVRAAQAGLKMTNVQEVLLLYRVHESQISTSNSKEQCQYSQNIRMRYWNLYFAKNSLNRSLIAPMFEIQESIKSQVDFNFVDETIAELLNCGCREARDVIWKNSLKLYLHAAGNYPDIVKRWRELNKKFNGQLKFNDQMKLWILSNFRIKSHSRLFNFLRMFHLLTLKK